MRRTEDVHITPETCPTAVRDHGKTFRITEMSAFAAEEWGSRATLALVPRLSREVDPATAEELKENSGMLSTVKVGMLLGGISFPEMRELGNELLKCARVVTDPTGRLEPRELGFGGMEDIEEVETIRYLRERILALHAGFTFAAAIFGLVAAISMTQPSEITRT